MIHTLGHVAFSLTLNIGLVLIPTYFLNLKYLYLSLISAFHHTKLKYFVLVLTISIFILNFDHYFLLHLVISFLSGYIYDMLFISGLRIKKYSVFLFSNKLRLRKNSIGEIALIIFLLGLSIYSLHFIGTYDFLLWKLDKLKEYFIFGKFCTKYCYFGEIISISYGKICILDLEYRAICFNRYNLTAYEIVSIYRS